MQRQSVCAEAAARRTRHRGLQHLDVQREARDDVALGGGVKEGLLLRHDGLHANSSAAAG